MEASEMSDKVIEVSWEKCAAIQRRWEVTLQPREFEDALLDLLVYVKSYQDRRDDFVTAFSEIVASHREGPLEILVFCMRELQWPEIRSFAISKIEGSTDPRVRDVLADLLDVYEAEWEDSVLYEYYRAK
jgi:hypothetical protein